jgi:N-acetylglucosamine kinase-like BadF-type ATPase
VTVVLAVDGGNSKTDVAGVRADGSLVGYIRGPGCSPHRLGVEGSLDVVASLAEGLGVRADFAMLLIAAVDFPDEELAYDVAARRRALAADLEVGNDTFAVLRAGTDRSFGVAVTCGAGINCVGVAPDGRRVRFDSLGDVSGDWGGGTDVGLAAVWSGARSADGRGPRTVFEQLAPQHFGCADPTALARALHAREIAWDRLGELAPLVFEVADADRAAGEIVDRQAEEIVAYVRAALQRLGLAGEEVEVILGGGVLQAGNARLLDGIEAGLQEVGPRLVVRVARSRPIVGAALLGLDRIAAEPEAYERARAELDRATESLGRDVAGDAAPVPELP